MAGFPCLKRVISALFLGLLTSCSPFLSKKPSVVLILLEAYSEQDYLCSDPRRMDGLTELQDVCQDLIRFTHVYAPSSMTQVNISGLLSGLPVSEHGVSDNGPKALSGRLQTLAEEALQFKMRTAFFSGGVPVLNKFGISQGYEEFIEPFSAKTGASFRSFSSSVDRAMRWLDREVKTQSFFATFYAPDLLYENLITRDGLDNERPIGYQSAHLELHETIDDLITGLKERKRWKNTHFIVLGLNGPQNSIHPVNPLSSQFLHVPLQIKLAERLNSNFSELTSEMISFDKLGGWVRKMIQHKPSQGDLILAPDPEDHFIPQQNPMSRWLGFTDWVTFGLRKKQFLFAFNPNLKVYDSFVDKREYEPLFSVEAEKLVEKYEIPQQVQSFYPDECFQIVTPSKCPKRSTDRVKRQTLLQLVQWSESLWPGEQPVDDFNQKMVAAVNQREKILLRWLAYQAMVHKRWADLFELGQKARVTGWKLLAQLNLRENPSFEAKSCYRFFVTEKKTITDFYQHCQDTGLRRVIEGLEQLKSRKRPQDSFWSQVDLIKSRRLALNLNIDMLFVNDIKKPFDFAPSLSEMYFFLPENRDFLNLIQFNES